ERIGSPADPAFVIQKLGAAGQPPQDLATGDDLPDAGLAARFNTQTVDAALRWQVPEDGRYQVLLNDLYGSQRGQPRLTYRPVTRRAPPGLPGHGPPRAPKAPGRGAGRGGGTDRRDRRRDPPGWICRGDPGRGPRPDAGPARRARDDRAGPDHRADRLRGRRA